MQPQQGLHAGRYRERGPASSLRVTHDNIGVVDHFGKRSHVERTLSIRALCYRLHVTEDYVSRYCASLNGRMRASRYSCRSYIFERLRKIVRRTVRTPSQRVLSD